MRSLLSWGCAAAVVQTAVGTQGNCGKVEENGTIWDHDSDPACNGKGTISQNKCWFRKGVDTYKCQENDEYDYYAKVPGSSDFEKFPNLNCYVGAGADSGTPVKWKGVGSCKHSCKNDTDCDGVVVHALEHFSDQETRIHKCWLRKDIELNSCAKKSSYDLYLHTKEHPANFDQHFHKVNCYGGKGASSSYGKTPLKYADGTLITHLGECKAACHSDPDHCEGIVVLPKSDDRLLADNVSEPEPASALFATARVVPASRATSWLAPAGLCLGVLAAACAVAAVVRRAPATGDGRGLALVQPEAEGTSDDA